MDRCAGCIFKSHTHGHPQNDLACRNYLQVDRQAGLRSSVTLLVRAVLSSGLSVAPFPRIVHLDFEKGQASGEGEGVQGSQSFLSRMLPLPPDLRGCHSPCSALQL